jgi:hypothetical protein
MSVKELPPQPASMKLLDAAIQSWRLSTQEILRIAGEHSGINFLLWELYSVLTMTVTTSAGSDTTQELKELAEQHPSLVERYSK